MRNRLYNCKNPAQGDYKKVLTVCSAGLLRSPTAAIVLSQEPFNYNTRSCGADKGHALIPVDPVLLEWADEIVCMQQEHVDDIKALTDKPVICLHIEDSFNYRDEKLMWLIKEKYLSAKEEREHVKEKAAQQQEAAGREGEPSRDGGLVS